MNELTVGKITFESAPIGAVLDRPTEERARLWRKFAAMLDAIEHQKKKERKKKRED